MFVVDLVELDEFLDVAPSSDTFILPLQLLKLLDGSSRLFSSPLLLL